jgi:dUTP pyrophosphatase
LIIEKYTRTEIEEVEDLDATVRGEGGFGSTGVKQLDGNVNKENV